MDGAVLCLVVVWYGLGSERSGSSGVALNHYRHESADRREFHAYGVVFVCLQFEHRLFAVFGYRITNGSDRTIHLYIIQWCIQSKLSDCYYHQNLSDRYKLHQRSNTGREYNVW